MAVLALILFAIYFLIGFVLRTVPQLHRTGDSGFRGLSGRPGSARWWAGILFSVALIAGLLGPTVALGGIAVLLVALHRQVRVVEEPYLLATHGDTYRQYAATTGRFLPSIGRLTSPTA